MEYMELSVTYLLNEREQKALEELLPYWQEYRDKDGSRPFQDWTIKELFQNVMTVGGKYVKSKQIKEFQFRQHMIDASELIGDGEFLLAGERQEIHDKLQKMTLEEKVNFLEEYEDMKSKDPLEKTISPMDVRLHEILSKERCGKIWTDIRMNGLESNHALVNAIGRLDALTGKENSLRDVKLLAYSEPFGAVKEAAEKIMDEVQMQEIRNQMVEQEIQNQMFEKSKHMSGKEKEVNVMISDYIKKLIEERPADDSFKYKLLDRMKQDCGYYLGYGNRQKQCLWSLDEIKHIENMKALYNSFPEDGKPEWLTMEDIEKFEKEMCTGVSSEKSIYSIRMWNETRYFVNISELDAEMLYKAYAECESPFMEMAKYGKEIEMGDFAYIQQGGRSGEELAFSVEFNVDLDEITIGDGEGFETMPLSGTMEKIRGAIITGKIQERQQIRQDIRANGFKATTTLVVKIELLDALNGKHNTLQDIKEMAKNPDVSIEVQEAVNGIIDELQRQELKMQAPEPPVEPAM